ncbi:MAG: hypothetical protein AAFO04_24145, partial [Cyanobacteria bacterium J06592_8]
LILCVSKNGEGGIRTLGSFRLTRFQVGSQLYSQTAIYQYFQALTVLEHSPNSLQVRSKL